MTTPLGSSTASSPAVVEEIGEAAGRGPEPGKPNMGNQGPTTPDDLREMLSSIRYASQLPCRHYDEIITGLYIGDIKIATNLFVLEKLGISHILNVAQVPYPFGDCELSEKYYNERHYPCAFLGIPAHDYAGYKICRWFQQTSNYIHDCLKANGRVLVHCQVGISRSATIVIAYLMMKHQLPVADAVQLVGSRRPIYPNDGFLKQLCDLDEHLSQQPKSKNLIRSLSSLTRRTLLKLMVRRTRGGDSKTIPPSPQPDVKIFENGEKSSNVSL